MLQTMHCQVVLHPHHISEKNDAAQLTWNKVKKKKNYETSILFQAIHMQPIIKVDQEQVDKVMDASFSDTS